MTTRRQAPSLLATVLFAVQSLTACSTDAGVSGVEPPDSSTLNGALAADSDVGTTADTPAAPEDAPSNETDIAKLQPDVAIAAPDAAASVTIVSVPGARVEIPDGALAQTVPIAIALATVPPAGAVSQVWQMTPEGTKFAQPVRVVLTVDSGTMSMCNFDGLRVATWTGEAWVPLTSPGNNAATREIWGETSHFSMFAVVMPATPPSTGPCPANFTSQGGKCVCTAKSGAKSISYDFCKAIFVGGLDHCFSDQGYGEFDANLPCCEAQFDVCKFGIPTGIPPQSVSDCLAKLPCALDKIDAWQEAAKCGAFP
jgi:hypothetical protein